MHRLLLAGAALFFATAAQAAGPRALRLLPQGAPLTVMRALGSGVPAGVDLNFAAGLYWPINALGRSSVTRASPAECADAAGNWYAAAAGQFCITNLGALIEEARTNSIRNNTMQGASAGVAPTNWAITGANNVTLTVGTPFVSGGVNYLPIAFSGTANASGNACNILFDTTTAINALYGQTWTLGQNAYYSGAVPAFFTNLAERASAGTALANNFVFPSITTTPTRTSGSATLSNAATAHLLPVLCYITVNSTTYSGTLYIGWPQLENNSSINSTVASATVNAGGSLYTPSSSGTVTWSGSGCATNPVLNVTTNSGGAVSGVTSVATAGSCTTFPSSSATTWTDGTGLGTGSGASFNLVPTNLAANACATSPILTTSGAATRAATVATQVLPAGATSTSGYSLLGIGTPECPTGYPLSQTIATISDGTTNNRLAIFRGLTSGIYVVRELISGASTDASPSGTWANNTQAKISAFAFPNGLKGVANNGTITSSSPTGLANVSALKIGDSATGGAPWNGTIARLVVAPASLLNN